MNNRIFGDVDMSSNLIGVDKVESDESHCTNSDVAHMEAVTSKLIDHLVNIDLANYQYNVAQLLNQAMLIGIEQ